MTDAIDPMSIKWTNPIAKLTGGFILGDKDPISKLLGVDRASIESRLAAKEAAGKPRVYPAYPTTAVRSVAPMEAKERGTRVAYSEGHGGLLGEDSVAGASVKLTQETE